MKLDKLILANGPFSFLCKKLKGKGVEQHMLDICGCQIYQPNQVQKPNVMKSQCCFFSFLC